MVWRFKILLKILLIKIAFANSSIDRISPQTYVKGEVRVVRLKPSLVAKIKLPCNIAEVVSAQVDTLQINISEKFPKELNISLLSKNALPTNLIVNCNKGRTFVFDIVPDSNNHTDVLKIKRYVYKFDEFELVETSKRDRKESSLGNISLIKSSKYKINRGVKNKKLIERSHK